MNEAFIKNIRVIKKAIAERKLVVFAGAGVSIDSGVPSWSTLINELRSEIEIPANEEDFLRVAQMYYNERQQKEFIDKVRETLKHKKLRYNEIHESIFELNPEHIVTTNFDDLLEQVIKAKAYPFSIIKKDSEFPYGRNTKLVVKVHGDLDEGNLVIKEDDYLEYSNNHPLIESFIKGVFANKVVLFIGYSFSDVNLKIILQSVRNILGKDFQNAYMLDTEKCFHPAKRQYLKNKGINVINYDDAGEIFGQNAIEQYLIVGRNALNSPIIERNKILSEKGAKLFYLIKFINKYFDFAESIMKEDIVTQMHKSLFRFIDIRVLPPKFLSNLFPFNNSKRYIHNYYNNTLGSNNAQLTKFFFEEFDPESKEINEKFLSNYPGPEQIEVNKKLNEVIEKMNFSSILHFGRSKSKIELFEYPAELPEKINLIPPNRNCQCLSCLYNDFRIKDFLKNLKEASITETTAIPDDLLLAYSNYKAGHFKTAYNQFEEIANKAWQLERYIPYYIAKTNIKYLRNMISWRDESISNENKRAIVEKIDDLDLDKLLFQIPSLDDDEYNLLKKIRDDDILLEVENELNEYYDKIIEIHRGYKKGGFSSTGPYYPHLIAEELLRLFHFYTYNYIVKDEYTNFTRVMQKGLRAFLICYSIDEKYPQRLTNFDFWVLRFMILYENEETLLKTFNNYDIKTIAVDEENFSKTITFLNNLFESGFSETTFLGRAVNIDTDLAMQANNYFFQDNFRTITHNALLVFAGIIIPKQYSTRIIRNFLDFLKTQNILFWNSERYLNKFLINIKDHFLYDDFLELLQIISETEAPYANDDFFRIIGFGIHEQFPEKKIDNDNLISAIIEKYLKSEKHGNKNAFMYLSKACNENNRKNISEAINQSLTSQFDTTAYLNACFDDIILPSTFLKNYIEVLERNIPMNHIEGDSQTPFSKDFTFRNLLHLIYIKDIPAHEIPFTKWDKYPDVWKFFFDYKTFDYSTFNSKWLLIVNTKFVHSKLREMEQIRTALEDFLKKNNVEELAKLYVQFYLK